MEPTTTVDKTVYILGAGFSAPAGGPPQNQLLQRIFALSESNSRIRKSKNEFKSFLINVLNVAPEAIATISLEDVYTPMDRCLADGVSLKGVSAQQLQALRADMEFLISIAIDKAFRPKSAVDRKYIDDFANYLVITASKRAELARNTDSARLAKRYDPFSIISLNWDIALDQSLYSALMAHDGPLSGDYDPIGVVDYCCYISSLNEGEGRIRTGLWALGSRGYNVKLLKIHGSMNWLQCSNCQQLFVAFDGKKNIPNAIDSRDCRHCAKRGVKKAKLQGSLVMPTFLKDLSNFQIKLVWQNAAVELMEARKLVFIGYSLPHADFEFRQLLTRMVQKDVKVHAVLFDSGTQQYKDECKRYEQFFSGHELSFEPNGVQEFVARLTK